MHLACFQETSVISGSVVRDVLASYQPNIKLDRLGRSIREGIADGKLQSNA